MNLQTFYGRKSTVATRITDISDGSDITFSSDELIPPSIASSVDHTSVDENDSANSSEQIGYSSDDQSEDEEHQETIYMSKNKDIQWHLMPRRPVTTRRSAENIFNQTHGPTRHAKRNIDTKFSAFQLFFANNVTDQTLKWTNKEGLRVFQDKWNKMDKKELHLFFGVLILAGVYKSKNEAISQLWNKEHGRPIFSNAMARNRFSEISRCLRFDDVEKRRKQTAKNKLDPIKDVFENFVKNLQDCYVPSVNVTIDEQLVTFRGRCPFKQYIPSKPGKYGIKIWCCCDSDTSYVYNMQVYTGKEVGQPQEKNQGERVVLDMVKGLENSGRNITCDNFFTSLKLAKTLKENRLTILGTVRKNRIELPKEFVSVKGRSPCSSMFAFNDDAALVSYCPKKGRVVVLLSTMHNQPDVDECSTARKPVMILDYNSTKGGVDTADQMLRCYSTKRKTNRWPVVVFYNMLDVACLNAFVLWMHLDMEWCKSKSHKRRLFLIQLATEMIYFGKESQIAKPPEKPTGSRKRGRCHICPREIDRKCRDVCGKCQKFICREHLQNLCEKCNV